MRRRYELTDREWSIIAPLLPNKPRGVPRVDDRRVLNGILWRFRAGTPWAEIPERYGPPTTCYNRFVRWRKAGVWDRLMAAVVAGYDGDMGRSRGGLTTKIHAVVDADGRPMRLALTAGQAHDGRPAEELLGDLREGAILLADRAYDSNAIRDFAKARGAWPNIPPKRNRKVSFVFSPGTTSIWNPWHPSQMPPARSGLAGIIMGWCHAAPLLQRNVGILRRLCQLYPGFLSAPISSTSTTSLTRAMKSMPV